MTIVGVTPSIELGSDCGDGGRADPVTLTGTGFGPGRTERITVAGTGFRTTVKADRDGELRATVTVPSAPDTYVVRVGKATASYLVPCATTSTTTTSTTTAIREGREDETDSLPVWPAVGLIGLLAVIAVAAVARRRQRVPQATPTAWGELIWRTARIEMSSHTVMPGSTVAVTVRVDAAAEQGTVPVGVGVRLLCSDDLGVVDGPGVGSFTIEGGADPAAAPFSVLVDPDAPAGAVGQLTALFTHNNRPCGQVRADVTIGGPDAATARPAAATKPSMLRIEPGATPPDLLVRVTATAANDGRSFLCEVISRFGGDAPSPQPWNLPQSAPALVEALMGEFTGREMSPRHRRDTLVGAGAELFDVAPSNFKEVLWRLIDDGRPPRSLFICSEEPAIPWELMVPNRALPSGGNEYRQPLGVEFTVGRWVGDPAGDPRLGNPHQAPLQIGRLARSVVIAPTYVGNMALDWATAEVELVLGHVPGIRLSPARYDEIDERLQATDADLLHFVGHGRAQAGGAHVIVLEDGQTLSSSALRGMEGARSFGGRCHPVVFLNGCEVGRLRPALAGADGFATTLIRHGARCVIAPLWSVKDEVAHQVATEFYDQHMGHPDMPLGQLFQAIRRRAYDADGGEDSWAAYAFFGDPLTRAAGGTL